MVGEVCVNWEQRYITVETWDAGNQSVQAYTYGQLAIVPMRAKGEWLVDGKFGVFSITHIASGERIVGDLYSPKLIAALVEALSALDFDSYFDDILRGFTNESFQDRADEMIEEWKGINHGWWE